MDGGRYLNHLGMKRRHSMGMFDWVEAPGVLCKCGRIVTGWQSKDGPCGMIQISRERVWNYHASCECGAWHEFRRIPIPEFEHFIDGKLEKA